MQLNFEAPHVTPSKMVLLFLMLWFSVVQYCANILFVQISFEKMDAIECPVNVLKIAFLCVII